MSNSIQIPSIIKETSSGYVCCSIQDEMFKRREIDCMGEINDESVNALILQLRYLEKIDPQEEITLFINSPGGEVGSGLALYDVMEAVTCPIRTVCVGMAASMAAILFSAGDKREILSHSKVMVHDPLVGGGGLTGSAMHIDSQAQNLMNIRETTASILAKHAHRSLEEIYEKTAKDTYFSADEAIQFGLADRIIERI